MARPMLFMIVFTSAKSKFMRPGCVIKSVRPLTPSKRTLSAFLKASAKEVCSLETLNKLIKKANNYRDIERNLLPKYLIQCSSMKNFPDMFL